MHKDYSFGGQRNPSGLPSSGPVDKKNGFLGDLPHTEPQITLRANGLEAG